jgi:hypothetical protein
MMASELNVRRCRQRAGVRAKKVPSDIRRMRYNGSAVMYNDLIRWGGGCSHCGEQRFGGRKPSGYQGEVKFPCQGAPSRRR